MLFRTVWAPFLEVEARDFTMAIKGGQCPKEEAWQGRRNAKVDRNP